MTPPDPVSANIYALSEAELAKMGIDSLPTSLYDAVQQMKKDPFMRETLGDHVYHKYVEAKEKEWNRFNTMVSQWELEDYLAY